MLLREWRCVNRIGKMSWGGGGMGAHAATGTLWARAGGPCLDRDGYHQVLPQESGEVCVLMCLCVWEGNAEDECKCTNPGTLHCSRKGKYQNVTGVKLRRGWGGGASCHAYGTGSDGNRG